MLIFFFLLFFSSCRFIFSLTRDDSSSASHRDINTLSSLRICACETAGTLEEEALGAVEDNGGEWWREERLFCDERWMDKP